MEREEAVRAGVMGTVGVQATSAIAAVERTNSRRVEGSVIDRMIVALARQTNKVPLENTPFEPRRSRGAHIKQSHLRATTLAGRIVLREKSHMKSITQRIIAALQPFPFLALFMAVVSACHTSHEYGATTDGGEVGDAGAVDAAQRRRDSAVSVEDPPVTDESIAAAANAACACQNRSCNVEAERRFWVARYGSVDNVSPGRVEHLWECMEQYECGAVSDDTAFTTCLRDAAMRDPAISDVLRRCMTRAAVCPVRYAGSIMENCIDVVYAASRLAAPLAVCVERSCEQITPCFRSTFAPN